MVRFPRGLYAVTPDETDTEALVARVRAAIIGGAAAVQYRNKTATPQQRRIQASTLAEVCRAAQVPFVVNDDLAITLAVGADGVHLGREDGDLPDARVRLGAQRLLGVSCYADFGRAQAAAAAGADYVAFGAAFPSSTKPDAVRAPLALYTRAKQSLAIPVVAIGGITLENAPEVIAAGADAVAVISALFEAPDIAARARAFRRLFERAP
jgi:thiamine-phosphate pyrophosphorylase